MALIDCASDEIILSGLLFVMLRLCCTVTSSVFCQISPSCHVQHASLIVDFHVNRGLPITVTLACTHFATANSEPYKNPNVVAWLDSTTACSPSCSCHQLAVHFFRFAKSLQGRTRGALLTEYSCCSTGIGTLHCAPCQYW